MEVQIPDHSTTHHVSLDDYTMESGVAVGYG